MLVGQPLQEPDRLIDLVGRHPGRRRGPEFGHYVKQPGLEPGPVVHRVAHIAQRAIEGLLEFDDVALAADAVDLHVHPGLPHPLRAAHRCRTTVFWHSDGSQLACDVTLDVELRVDDQVQRVLQARQRHRDGVDEERHVVGDDLHHRVTGRRPALLRDPRGEHAHLGRALWAIAGGLVVRGQRAVHVGLATIADILSGDVPVVAGQQGTDLGCRGSTRGLALASQLGGSVDQVGLGNVQSRGHVYDSRTHPCRAQHASSPVRTGPVSDGSPRRGSGSWSRTGQV